MTWTTATGVPVAVICAVNHDLEELERHLRPDRTGVLIGSSGVGKSTFINRLLGREAMGTREVRSGDDRGRHTTTRRELFRLPSRLESYFKLRREAEALARRQDERSRRQVERRQGREYKRIQAEKRLTPPRQR